MRDTKEAVPQTVAFHTLGCKLNFSETSTFARQFESLGLRRCVPGEVPDIVVVNSCAVTEQAQRKCRQLLRKVQRQNPDALRVVVGCYAELAHEDLSSRGLADLALTRNQKPQLAKISLNAYQHGSQCALEAVEHEAGEAFFPAFSLGDRTRAFLKIQDGCSYQCTYCAIPLARGMSRSATTKQIIHQAERIVSEGTREIVLTGVNTGDFGRHTGEKFIDLLRELDRIPGLARVRISSIEPNLITDEILHFISGSRVFLPHLHIPLQSGSPDVLRRMKRRYTPQIYLDRVEQARAILPDPFLGVDVIVGFPGERDEDFAATYNLLAEMEPSFLHIFPYSRRPNTPAATMPNHVPSEIIQERAHALAELSDRLHTRYCLAYAGVERPVLVERIGRDGMAQGFTDNYIKTQFPAQDVRQGQIALVQLGQTLQKGRMDSRMVELCA